MAFHMAVLWAPILFIIYTLPLEGIVRTLGLYALDTVEAKGNTLKTNEVIIDHFTTTVYNIRHIAVVYLKSNTIAAQARKNTYLKTQNTRTRDHTITILRSILIINVSLKQQLL